MYAGAATVIDLLVAFPLVYWIAFRARRKSVFLMLLLVPFFVSYVIRTILWQFILSDNGVVLGSLKAAHLLPERFHVLDTGFAVIAGLAYSYFPFAALPMYVALERIDKGFIEAAFDLYARRPTMLRRVVLPLALPGIFAAVLLTFVPAAGDYVNAHAARRHGQHDDRQRDPERVPGVQRLPERLGAVGDPDGDHARRHLHLRARPRHALDRGVRVSHVLDAAELPPPRGPEAPAPPRRCRSTSGS